MSGEALTGVQSAQMLGPRPTIHWASQLIHPSRLFFIKCALIPVVPALRCSRKTICKLLGILQNMQGSSAASSIIPRSTIDSAERLELYLADLDSYSDNVASLHQKCTGLAQVFDRSLTFEQSQIAHAQNNKMTQLAGKTADESLTARSITVVPLIYLSFTVIAASFLSTLRNLADTDKARQLSACLSSISTTIRGRFYVSSWFWVYVVVALPLTAFSLSCWRWSSRRARSCKPHDA